VHRVILSLLAIAGAGERSELEFGEVDDVFEQKQHDHAGSVGVGVLEHRRWVASTEKRE
jgi:hypothetical protein